MPYLITLLSRGGLVWMLAWSLCCAQPVAPLTPQPDSLRRIAAEEKDALRHHDSLKLAEAWFRFGKVYERGGHFRISQGYFLRSLRIIEPRGDSYELSRLYARLSNYEAIQHNYSIAIQYARRSLRVAQRIDSKPALIRAYTFLGKAYEVGWHDQAARPAALLDSMVLCYRRSESLCYQTRDTLGIAELKVVLGEVFLETHDARAVPYLEEALQLFTLKKKKGILPNVFIDLSAAYLAAGQPGPARQALEEGEIAYQQLHRGDIDILMKLTDGRAAYFEHTRQWQRALEYTRKANALKQQKLHADREGAIGRLNIEYETEKREALLQTQAHELDTLRLRQRFMIVTSLLLLLTAGLSGVFYRLYRKNQRTSHQNRELVREQNHRVKNNLQVISSMLSLQARQLSDQTARRAIEESQLRVQTMAVLHRRLYDGAQLAHVALGEFIRELVGGVLHTFGQAAVVVHYEINPIFLSADKATPLGLILNELTTNACKYAFPFTTHPVFTVSCQQQKRTIRLRVTDNGPGFKEMPPGHTGNLETGPGTTFGLLLIQAQVVQLNGAGHYQAPAAPASQPPGTLFVLTFTL